MKALKILLIATAILGFTACSEPDSPPKKAAEAATPSGEASTPAEPQAAAPAETVPTVEAKVPGNDEISTKALAGDKEAQFKLGLTYRDGKGVPRDFQQAFAWFTKAANQGHAIAQFFLGVMYENGEGIPQSDDQAVYWYTKAAALGDSSAKEKLAAMHAKSK